MNAYDRADMTVKEAAQTAEWTQVDDDVAVLWDKSKDNKWISGYTVDVQA